MNHGGSGFTFYIARRLLEMPVVLLFVIIVNFTIIHLAPGDPASVMIGDFAFTGSGGTRADAAAYLEEVKEKWGLNKPLPEQLWIYASGVARGDLGFSLAANRPVLDLILQRVPATLLLLFVAEFFAVMLGTLLGAYAASKHPSRLDAVVSGTSITLHSVPVFWSGLLLILILGVRLRVLPTSGMTSTGIVSQEMPYVLDVARHMVLPVLALVLFRAPVLQRVTRATMLEIVGEDYVRTARAKGLRERTVFGRHALRNALLPTVTLLGLSLGSALSGAVLIETVFAWPGIGRLLFDSISLRDYPLLMGVLVISSVGVVLASLITDLAYAKLDPRVVYR